MKLTPVLIVALTFALGIAAGQQPNSTGNPGGSEPEVLIRGPVHEAYASAIVDEPKPGLLAPKEPPKSLEELPPDQKPEGENAQWIPGYWHFDDERADYIWISGFWRVPPPNHQWVPGTWNQSGGQWRWTSGFWMTNDQKQIDYLPQPPEVPDVAPAQPAPSAEHTYVPGSWVYQDGRYLWRPGYWIDTTPGWVYVPPRYYWCPAGYIFCDGYWDYDLEHRGVLFCPVYVNPTLYTRGSYVFQPRHVVYDTALFGCLFVRSGYPTYYFGDYFDRRYATLGFRSWVDVRYGHGYDPLWNYYRITYGSHDHNWVNNITTIYQGRYRGDIPRPPRTLRQELAAEARAGRYAEYLNLSAPLDRVDARDIRLAKLSPVEKQRVLNGVTAARQAAVERSRFEVSAQGRSGQTGAQRLRFDVPRGLIGSGSTATGRPSRVDDRREINRPDTPAPRPKADRPDTPTPRPKIDRPDTPAPRPKADRPDTPTPRPKIDRPDTPTPRPKADRPDTPTPRPKIDRPDTPTPRPKADRPDTPTPRPKIDRPDTPAPRPKADRPDTPAPRPKADRPPQRPVPPKAPSPKVPPRPTPPPVQNPPQRPNPTPRPPTEKGKSKDKPPPAFSN